MYTADRIQAGRWMVREREREKRHDQYGAHHSVDVIRPKQFFVVTTNSDKTVHCLFRYYFHKQFQICVLFILILFSQAVPNLCTVYFDTIFPSSTKSDITVHCYFKYYSLKQYQI